MLADLRFHLSWLLISSCVFSGSGGTETELADLGPLVAPEDPRCRVAQVWGHPQSSGPRMRTNGCTTAGVALMTL
jgi:hypothetical protein